MTIANKLLGASMQESVYVKVLRQLADAVDAGVLDVTSCTHDDDLRKGELSICFVFQEADAMRQQSRP